MVKPAAVRLGQAHRERVEAGASADAHRAAILYRLAVVLCRKLGLQPDRLAESRLHRLAAQYAEQMSGFESLLEEAAQFEGDAPHLAAARLVGAVLDVLQAHERSDSRRKSGSYFTPSAVAEDLVGRAWSEVPALKEGRGRALFVCDPACGGGAFLLEAARQLSESTGERAAACVGLHGVDLSEVAIATTEVSLWIFASEDSAPVSHPDRFVVGDALWGASFVRDDVSDEDLVSEEGSEKRLDFPEAFPQVGEAGFDWIVGNPPWVAFQGRATQKISTARRQFYRTHYEAFTGYPTLHSLFIQRATELAPQGAITLLVPSSVSDLDGYRRTRAALTNTHFIPGTLPEYGQDAFDGVVQPCFGLIASAGRSDGGPSEDPWPLEEKSHARSQVKQAPPPRVLLSFETWERLASETFREVGFQSNRTVAQELFFRGEEPPASFSVPLLEGRNVGEFVEREPRLFLRPDEGVLTATRCRLKPKEAYERVDVVVRQTAAFTIAARHEGHRFRNSLIGAFATNEVSADLLVGLMNSALFRALHVCRQRDARQAAFPQVKLSHLRRLPAPPTSSAEKKRVAELSKLATIAGGITGEQRLELDAAVFDLYRVEARARQEIVNFLQERAPGALRASIS